MNRNLLNSALAGIAACIMQGTAFASDHLAVSLVVLTSSGEPVAGIEIIAGHSRGLAAVAAIGATDANGHVDFVLSRPTEDVKLGIILSDGVAQNSSAVQSAERYEAYWALARENAWKAVEWYPIAANSEVASLTLRLQPAVSVSGASSTPTQAGCGNGWVQRRESELPAHFDGASRAFELLGVPRAQSTELFFVDDCACVSWVGLTAAQTEANLDLGNVNTGCGIRDASAIIQFVNTDWPPPASDSMVAGVALIRADGAKILNFVAEPDGSVVTDYPGASSTTLPIPAGTWYLVPGLFDPSEDLPLRAFDLVRSGQTALVPNWPTITVAPGETATATVHAAELDAAIRATMPPE